MVTLEKTFRVRSSHGHTPKFFAQWLRECADDIESNNGADIQTLDAIAFIVSAFTPSVTNRHSTDAMSHDLRTMG
jgi:hypothetical protein